jgi:hypothetical protein
VRKLSRKKVKKWIGKGVEGVKECEEEVECEGKSEKEGNEYCEDRGCEGVEEAE